jgi:hypothetical protein
MATVLGRCSDHRDDDVLLAAALNAGFRLLLERDVATGQPVWRWQRDEPRPGFSSRDSALRWMRVLLECHPRARHAALSRVPSS